MILCIDLIGQSCYSIAIKQNGVGDKEWNIYYLKLNLQLR